MAEEYSKNRFIHEIRMLSLFFGLFIVAATAHAQLLGLGPPDITVQPMGRSVQNGDTVTFTAAANCNLGSICNVAWHFKNGKFPDNATVSVTGLGTMNVSTTLTLTNVSTACVGDYSVEIEDELLGGLLGLATATAKSQDAPLSIIPTVVGVTSGSVMVEKGFKIQFSAPIGSNLVIQATSDMKNWTSLCTNKVTDGSVTFTDTVATTVSARFYRAKLK